MFLLVITAYTYFKNVSNWTKLLYDTTKKTSELPMGFELIAFRMFLTTEYGFLTCGPGKGGGERAFDYRAFDYNA